MMKFYVLTLLCISWESHVGIKINDDVIKVVETTVAGWFDHRIYTISVWPHRVSGWCLVVPLHCTKWSWLRDSRTWRKEIKRIKISMIKKTTYSYVHNNHCDE